MSYNERGQYQKEIGHVEAPEKIKKDGEGYGGFPFVLYAIWAPDREGYLAGIPQVYDNTNIVRDNEVHIKTIKLFITEEKAQDWLDEITKDAARKDGDIECIKKLLIVRLNPAGWHKPMFHPN